MNGCYGVIYKIQNKINHKIYIGQTIYNFKRRYGYRLSQVKNPYLKADIKKYGYENFIIDEHYDEAQSKEELDELEIKYIAQYDSTNREKGYNIQAGGHNALHSEETKFKIGEKQKGNLNHNYGKYGINSPKFSRKKFICAKCGKEILVLNCRINRSKKHYCSDKCRQADISNTRIRGENKIKHQCDVCGKVIFSFPSIYNNKKYHTCSVECQNKLYANIYKGKNNPNYNNHKVAGGNNGRARKVRCIETNEIFDCTRNAESKYNIVRGGVGAVCRGEQKTSGGYHWEYI